MSSIVIELQSLYERYFGKKPVVVSASKLEQFINGANVYDAAKGQDTSQGSNKTTGILGSTISISYHGVEVWLPVKFSGLPTSGDYKIGDGTLLLPYCTISIRGSNDMVRTPMNLRRGTVKELFSMNDYEIGIKGFFIDKAGRSFPEQDIINLKNLHEMGKSFFINNALTNVFLNVRNQDPSKDNTDQVVITKFEMPEVTGGRKSMRPFMMELLSDSVFTLEEA